MFKERVNSVASIRAEKVGVSECVCVSVCMRERERMNEKSELI